MRPSVLYHDSRRLLRALRVHRGERNRAQRLDLGLAYLEVKDEVAVPSRDATYRTAVTNLGPEMRQVELVLDFWIHEPAKAHHVGYLLVQLSTRPRSRLDVEMSWDGVEPGRAHQEDHSLPCRTWFGAVNRPGQCDVLLTLRGDSRVMDKVQSRQRREAIPA